MKNRNEADYWDYTIYISPKELAKMRADCGDTYTSKTDEQTGFREPLSEPNDYSVSWLQTLMVSEKCGLIGTAWGSKSTSKKVNEFLRKGVTIVINARGNVKVIAGDAMLEARK